MDILSTLQDFSWPDQAPFLPGYQGAKAIAGRMGSVVFVATEDYDGQIEISLAAFNGAKRSGQKSKRCTKRQAKWFFDQLGVTPVEEIVRPATRHFVARRGAVQ